MAANATKAQVDRVFKEAGVQRMSMKLEGEELQKHIQRRSATFEDKRTKRNRDRSSQKRNAIKNGW